MSAAFAGAEAIKTVKAADASRTFFISEIPSPFCCLLFQPRKSVRRGGPTLTCVQQDSRRLCLQIATVPAIVPLGRRFSTAERSYSRKQKGRHKAGLSLFSWQRSSVLRDDRATPLVVDADGDGVDVLADALVEHEASRADSGDVAVAHE